MNQAREQTPLPLVKVSIREDKFSKLMVRFNHNQLLGYCGANTLELRLEFD
jgi:hypothetical protein